MPVIQAGSFDLDYVDAGSGPAVVLVHSSASGNRQWRRLIEELKHRRRLLAVNLFGYGATTPWPGTRPQLLADQAELVLAAAGQAEGSVALVGHSMGGAVALEAALKLGARLEVVIVFEPILFYLLKEHGEAAAFAEVEALGNGFRERAKRGAWNDVARMFTDYWSGDGTWAAMPDERKAGLLAMLPNVVHDFDSTVPGGRPLAEWGKIAAPVHVITAADTRLPNRRIAALLAAGLAHWHFHEVASGGHMAPVARPDLVNPLIARILDGTRGRVAAAARTV